MPPSPPFSDTARSLRSPPAGRPLVLAETAARMARLRAALYAPAAEPAVEQPGPGLPRRQESPPAARGGRRGASERRSLKRRPAPRLRRVEAAGLAGVGRPEAWAARVDAWRDITRMANNAYRQQRPRAETPEMTAWLCQGLADSECDIRTRLVRGACWIAEAVRDRFDVGYVWEGGALGAGAAGGADAVGRHDPAFVETGLRSDRHPLLGLMVAKIGRVDRRWWRHQDNGRLRAGWSKAMVERQTRKLFGLDHPYLVWNEDLRGVIRIDIDRDFASLAALRAELDAVDCPLPNVVVGDGDGGGVVDGDGPVRHPHLYWLLRDSVGFTPTHRRRPQTLYLAAVDALTRRLAGLGADAGASRNGLRGKNPFSPHNDIWLMAETPWRLAGQDPVAADRLPALAEYLPIAAWAAAAEADPMTEVATGSNGAWRAGLKLATTLIHDWKRQEAADLAAGDAAAAALAHAGFMAALTEAMLEIADRSPRLDERGARRMAERIGGHFWDNYRPARHRTPAADMDPAARRPRGRPRKTPVSPPAAVRRPGRPRKHAPAPADAKAPLSPARQAANAARRAAADRRIAVAADRLAAGLPEAQRGLFVPLVRINRRALAAAAGVSTATLADPQRIDGVEALRRADFARRTALAAPVFEEDRRATGTPLRRGATTEEKHRKNALVKKGTTIRPRQPSTPAGDLDPLFPAPPVAAKAHHPRPWPEIAEADVSAVDHPAASEAASAAGPRRTPVEPPTAMIAIRIASVIQTISAGDAVPDVAPSSAMDDGAMPRMEPDRVATEPDRRDADAAPSADPVIRQDHGAAHGILAPSPLVAAARAAFATPACA